MSLDGKANKILNGYLFRMVLRMRIGRDFTTLGTIVYADLSTI